MTEEQTPIIVWFREDLRICDNEALWEAANSETPVLCVYVHDQESPGVRPLGGAALWWLHGALRDLDEKLLGLGNGLAIFRGMAIELIPRIAQEFGASAVFWNRRYGAAERRIDAEIKATLRGQGKTAKSFSGNLVNEPWTLETTEGGPFRVFSAYWRAARTIGTPPHPLPPPRRLGPHRGSRGSAVGRVELDELGLEVSQPDWASGLRQSWSRGETGAQATLERFLEYGFHTYATERDRPDRSVTSQLSPYLRFGNISARAVWHAALMSSASRTEQGVERNLEKFLSELGWREFSYHLLYHFPDLAHRSYRPAFEEMPWRHDAADLNAWRKGRTGYPLVDAGMRELWHTGWMHNRVRMVVASFLTKHLLIDWRKGEEWFWDTLVDADQANNSASWQWVAGSGADAAPYFRIFNPVLQGEKFDPDGTYVKRWLPELAGLPASLINRPWEASTSQMAAAGMVLGETYPRPIVDHGYGRLRALEAVKKLA